MAITRRTSIRYLLACALILYILLVMLPVLVQPKLSTLGTAVLFTLSIVGGESWTSYVYRPWCYKYECCMDDWIPGNTTALALSLKEQLYGQHLVHKTIIAAIRGHLDNPEPPHPLVISFHGPTGTGKNYVSKIIAESMFREGLKSKYVHLRISTKHYPHRSDIKQYRKQIEHLISSKVADCQRQLFIFDEVENMPPGLLDSFRPFLDYQESIDGVDYRKSMFVFLSNIAAYAISNYTMNHYLDGNKREDIKLRDVEALIMKQAFNDKDTGMQHSRLLDSYLVSHFIPFLPLEIRHVRQCVNTELKARGFSQDESITEAVIEELQFYGPSRDAEIFALKGCKNVVEKLNLVTYEKFGYTENMYRKKNDEL
ncbi:torsin-1A-like [Amphiura filiformis]|uniref:torsin-1A-like n=1 Tax=Amphiura filiformis TaxID=82378 RepID=UPI003B2241FB